MSALVPLTPLEPFFRSPPLNLAKGITVTLELLSTGEAPTIFKDEAGTEEFTGTITTDNLGRVRDGGAILWVEVGTYRVGYLGTEYIWEAAKGDVAAEMADISAHVAVVKEAPLNVEYPEYGADGSGAEDSIEAFEKALAAQPAEGGEILALRRYKLSKGLKLDWPKHSVTIQGENSLHAGSSSRSMFIFTQGGEETLISARSGLGVHLSNIGVLPNNAAWEGMAIDFGSDGTHGQNTYSELERVNLISASRKGVGLSIDNTAGLLVSGCRISGFDIGVRGERKAADNSIGITFLGGEMLDQGTINVLNCGESWQFLGTVVEALHSGAAGFINVEEGITPRNLGLFTVWCGDGNNTGTCITWRGIGLQLMGGTLGGGAIGLSLPDTEATKTNVIEVKGTRFVGVDGIRANWAGGAGFDYDINPNNWVGNSGKKVSLDNGATDLGSGRLIPAGGLTIGADVKLSREGANVAQLNSQLRLVGASGGIAFIIRKLADESARVRISEEGKIDLGGGTAVTLDTNLYRNAADRLKTDDLLEAALGLATKTKAGAPVDADWSVAPPNGTLAVDTTNSKLYVRIGGAWKSVAVA